MDNQEKNEIHIPSFKVGMTLCTQLEQLVPDNGVSITLRNLCSRFIDEEKIDSSCNWLVHERQKYRGFLKIFADHSEIDSYTTAYSKAGKDKYLDLQRKVAELYTNNIRVTKRINQRINSPVLRTGNQEYYEAENLKLFISEVIKNIAPPVSS